MSETRKTFDLGLLALVPIVCCVGLPLIAADGVTVALALWVGGTAVAALVAITLIALLIVRERPARRS